MNFRPFLVLTGLLVLNSVTAQKKQALKEIFTTSPIHVKTPLMTDTVDIKGNKLTDTNILKMRVAVPDQDKFKETIKADSMGYFCSEKPIKDASFHLFSFYNLVWRVSLPGCPPPPHVCSQRIFR